ncbi:MAG: hypothetical protein BGO75_17315 [Burkholderiales bacterium 68-20]|nr:MAG: hypothetical protein BGO75_17315 [Burkholderiales bacterium 68-20]
MLSTFVQLLMLCQARRILLSGTKSLSLNTSLRESINTWVRVLVQLLPTLIMSFVFIDVESSSDKITFGAT